MILVPVDDDHLPQVPVQAGQILEVGTVNVSGCVSVQLVHDVLLLRVHAEDNWIKGHTVLHGPHDHLKIREP